MGSGGLSAKYMQGTEKEIIVLMMPVYYVNEAEVTEFDLKMANDSWHLIVEDKSPAYNTMKQDPDFGHNSCVSWFYTVFYERLFNVHPMCKPLFSSGIVSQGIFLVNMMSVTLSCFVNKTEFVKSMEKLALRHCERGVRGVEYGIVGDVLFYSIRKTIGEQAYTEEVEQAWVKIYSGMLAVIVPLVVEYERNGTVHRRPQRMTSYCTEVSTEQAKVDRVKAEDSDA